MTRDRTRDSSLQLRRAGGCCFLLSLPSQVRQDGVPVKHPEFGHRLLPQVGVKGHWDDGRLLQGEDGEVGPPQARHRQLTLDLCEVTVGLLQAVERRLKQDAREETVRKEKRT